MHWSTGSITVFGVGLPKGSAAGFSDSGDLSTSPSRAEKRGLTTSSPVGKLGHGTSDHFLADLPFEHQ
jgi:hypothetical protein